METYDRILKWNEDGMMCQTCVGCGENDICREWLDELKKYESTICTCYANDDQIVGLIKEADSGAHQWVRDNTLFECIQEEFRMVHCELKKPHKHNTHIEYGCRRTGHAILQTYRGSKSEKVTWPGRTDEDCSEVISKMETTTITESEYNQGKQFLKEKAAEMKEESGEMGKEYVVLVGFSIWSLAKTDIDANVIKNLMLNDAKTVWEIGDTLECKVCSPELMRLGFIEEKIEEPFISTGYTFKRGSDIYIVANTGPMKFGLVNMVQGNQWSNPVVCKEGIKLSYLVSNDRLKEFKPVTIKIEVVED